MQTPPRASYQPPQVATLADVRGEPYEYAIQPLDTFRIEFVNMTEFNTDVLVPPDGIATLPLIGSVDTTGKTTRSLKSALKARYAQILREPDLNVRLLATQPQYVYVGGEVRQGGRVDFNRNLTVAQAIFAAGGANRDASLRRVFVIRDVGRNTPAFVTLDYFDPKTKRVQDLYLRPKDIVVVQRSNIAEANRIVEQYMNQLLPFSKSLNVSYQFLSQPGAAGL